jgi:hypothetical protein
LKVEQINEGDESFPSTETKKRKDDLGLDTQIRKNSRAKKRTSKSRGSKLTTVTKVLLYVSVVSCELGIIDQHECTTGSCGLPPLETVDELEGKENKEIFQGVSIINIFCFYIFVIFTGHNFVL